MMAVASSIPRQARAHLKAKVALTTTRTSLDLGGSGGQTTDS